MKIAEVADVLVPVPPPKYGGTEYVISVVTEGLVARGHDVTLFASGDSITQANLIATVPSAIGFTMPNYDAWLARIRQLAHLMRIADQFDVIHNHLYETFALIPYINRPIVTTFHGSYSDPVTRQIMEMPEIQQTYFIAVSDSQRRLMPHLPFVRTIYHGVDIEEFPFKEDGGDYLLFVGRIAPEKGVEFAVEVAQRTGKKLVIAAKEPDVSPDEYVLRMLKLFRDVPEVEFIGEVGPEEKKELYSNALALLMPVMQEEPFGLVVVESMACGTPVIAFNRGSMPEIIEDGKSGFIVNDASEMANAVQAVSKLSRVQCRERVLKHFNLEQMVNGYEKAFSQLVS